MRKLLIRAGTRWVVAVLAALVIGHVVHKSMLAGSAGRGSLLEQFETSIFGPSQSDTLIPSIPPTEDPSLETVGAGEAGGRSSPLRSAAHQQPSFQERFASAFGRYSQEDEPTRAGDSVSPTPASALPPSHEAAPTSPGRSTGEALTAAQPQSPAAWKKSGRFAKALNELGSLPEADGRTAIYDIAAHAVYLPSGDRLEAHSGLGSKLDDSRYVSVKNGGPTPPNIYDLVLRKQHFHGVRAIRLIPIGEGQMFGRDGLLAHSYMLGPNGQSNGCVSFRDYPAFLNAFLKGEVERLVVVDHLAATPSAKSGSGWLPDSLWNFIKPNLGRVFGSSGRVDSPS
jgi:Protein of unknown function (DUF2778)